MCVVILIIGYFQFSSHFMLTDDNITVYTNISVDCTNIGVIKWLIKISSRQHRYGNTGESEFMFKKYILIVWFFSYYQIMNKSKLMVRQTIRSKPCFGEWRHLGIDSISSIFTNYP